MRYRLKLAALTLIAGLLAAEPAVASTLPDARIPTMPVLGFGLGPSISLDFPLADQFSAGLAVGIPFFEFNEGIADARFMYRVTPRDPLGVSLLLGTFIGFGGSLIGPVTPVGVEVGAGFSYDFPTAPVTIRANVVVGIPANRNFPRFASGFFSPSSGAEVGYKFTSNFEGTIGFNGMGDILGLRVYL